MKPIFLVDDSPTILMSISAILTKAGYACETAPSAEAATARVSAGLAPAMVITDYHMPGQNGVELIGALRKMGPTRFVPMLVLTTDSNQDKRSAAKAAGATGWLLKPVDPAALLQVVRQLVPGG